MTNAPEFRRIYRENLHPGSSKGSVSLLFEGPPSAVRSTWRNLFGQLLREGHSIAESGDMACITHSDGTPCSVLWVEPSSVDRYACLKHFWLPLVDRAKLREKSASGRTEGPLRT